MRDALGGAVNIFIIVLFIVFALGYMAYNVNYTKAFRMKNKVVSTYEKYKGNCNADCETEIKEYAQSIGYAPDYMGCESESSNKLYCVKAIQATQLEDMKTKCYYRITTRINISIPILENILAMQGSNDNNNAPKTISVFYVTGDTKTIELEEGSCS